MNIGLTTRQRISNPQLGAWQLRCVGILPSEEESGRPWRLEGRREDASMPAIETAVSIAVPCDATVAEIEEAVAAALREKARELVIQAVEVVEQAALQRAGHTVLRDKRRQVDVLTSWGWVRLGRLYVRDRKTGRYRYLVELGGQQHATPAVVNLAVALAARLPYRQAAKILGRFLGEDVDHCSLHAWVKADSQQAGCDQGTPDRVASRVHELPGRPVRHEVAKADRPFDEDSARWQR